MIRGAARIAVIESAAHGGLLHYHVQLAEALAERGHAVDLLTPRANELADRVAHARMRAVLAPPSGPADSGISGRAYALRRVAVGVRLTRAWLRILWETRPGRYEVVIVGADIGLPPAALAMALMASLPGRPTLVRVAHNVRAFNRWSGEAVYASSRVMDRLMAYVYPRFDLVLVHGERSRREFETNWPGGRIGVIPHGDERIFGEPPPPSDEERVLFFGDWRKVKGLGVLMEAFDELVRRRPTARLTVAGTPSDADWDPDVLRRWAGGHAGRVELIDRYVPIEEVAPVFARARVVVTPYLTGYQSGVIHLAMTMGRAVVTSDVGDLGTAVTDGVTGRVVPPQDTRALADALDEIIGDAGLAARFGDAARRRVEVESSWEHVAERVEQELLALRPGPRPRG
jgi:glycosyltransferase involved in cell wall biosynthesis